VSSSKAVALALAVAAVLLAGCDALGSQRGREFSRSAAAALRRGSLDSAIVLYDSAIAHWPRTRGRAVLFGNRAEVYALLGDLPDATRDLDSAVAIAPDYARAYARKADLHAQLHLPDSALADLDAAIRVAADSELAPLLVTRAGLRARRGRVTEAWADVDTVVARWPERDDGWLARADFFTQSGQPDSAVIVYDALIATRAAAEARPGGGGIHRRSRHYELRAAALAEQGRLALALASLDTATGLAPGQYSLYEARGRIYLELGRKPEAVADFRRALQLTGGADRRIAREVAAAEALRP
jgi:tetratricopeptide (TPR) repeat protein